MIHVSNISKHYGSKVLYQNAGFQINAGEKIGLVGPNGNGKTTIFKIIMGEEGIDSGKISKTEKCVIGYFQQKIEEMSGKTVLAEVTSAAGNLTQLQSELQKFEAKLSEPLDEDEMMKVLEKYGEAQSEFERLGCYYLESRAK